MKEKYRAFKEWKKNPRHSALFQLLCWFIFFAALYLLACAGVFSPKYQSISSNEKEKEFTTNSVENYGKMSNYEYEYSINYDDENIIIKGIVYGSKNYFLINDNEYFDDGTLYLVDHENQTLKPTTLDIPINLSEINQTSIYLWLNESKVSEKIEYKDGTMIITYLYSPTQEYSIKIIAEEKEYLMNNLKLDLLEYLSAKNLYYSNFTVDINYTNINNISNYEKNYDTYQILESTAEGDSDTTLVEGEMHNA